MAQGGHEHGSVCDSVYHLYLDGLDDRPSIQEESRLDQELRGSASFPSPILHQRVVKV